MKILSWLSFIAIIVSFHAVNGVRAQNASLDASLNAWIESDLHFLFDVNNRPKLAFRRKAVRAHVYSEIRNVGDDIKLAISLFSQAAGVPFEFTSLDPNILAVVAAPINEGSKPNRAFLKRLNLPDSAVDEIIASSDWSTGCGIYAFGDVQGEIALSLALADKNLSERDLKDCASEGIIRAFGLRTKRTSAVRSADGYFQYLALTNALRHCDGEIREAHQDQDIAILRPTYVRCAREFMKKTMTPP